MNHTNVMAYKSSVAHRALELIGKIYNAEEKLKRVTIKIQDVDWQLGIITIYNAKRNKWLQRNISYLIIRGENN